MKISAGYVLENIRRNRLFRYILNGIVATAVHFLLLIIGVEWVEVYPVGLANLIAYIGGVVVSFLGNRYFVFSAVHTSFVSQVIKFGLLYAVLAVFHGIVLFIWSDIYGLDYKVGFLIATFFQFLLSYIGNKVMVFK